MANAMVRQISGDKLTRGSKSKGKAFVREMNAALAPAVIARSLPQTQPRKK